MGVARGSRAETGAAIASARKGASLRDGAASAVPTTRQRAAPKSPPNRRGVRRRCRTKASTRSAGFAALDGRHPFQQAVPNGCVLYPARRREKGRVAWFNFELAKQLGLIPGTHSHRLTPTLSRAILRTFAIQIVNEWDQEHGPPVPSREQLPHPYMATRYLQLQHPDRRGATSGDGRSVWNGSVTHEGVTWDVSSCGTGVTRLCPATAQEKRFFKTGNRHASYGCGTAGIDEGFSAALMSEIFHRNGIGTERVLAVIEFENGTGIHVRAAESLLRPSHFFVHLRRSDLAALRAVADLAIERRIRNGRWETVPRTRRYARLAEDVARDFGRAAATFESEYVFCWLDWDGDNVLLDGSIIDYGSVRQFGLYHREYRFDDGPRWSTTIPQQRRKARGIVQCFAQIRDALDGGTRRPLAQFRNDPVLALFDIEFARTKQRLLLHKMGISPELASGLIADAAPAIARFQRAFEVFERTRSARGPRPVPDGLSWNAVFCMRDLLRELPVRYLRETRWLDASELIGIMASSYASRRDRAITPARARQTLELQRAYMALLRAAAEQAGAGVPALLADVVRRAAIIDRPDRITGDAIDHATGRILRRRRQGLSTEAVHELIAHFVARQDLAPLPPDAWQGEPPAPPERAVRDALEGLVKVVHAFREGL